MGRGRAISIEAGYMTAPVKTGMTERHPIITHMLGFIPRNTRHPKIRRGAAKTSLKTSTPLVQKEECKIVFENEHNTARRHAKDRRVGPIDPAVLPRADVQGCGCSLGQVVIDIQLLARTTP
jgi:hypothetical protein